MKGFKLHNIIVPLAPLSTHSIDNWLEMIDQVAGCFVTRADAL